MSESLNIEEYYSYYLFLQFNLKVFNKNILVLKACCMQKKYRNVFSKKDFFEKCNMTSINVKKSYILRTKPQKL